MLHVSACSSCASRDAVKEGEKGRKRETTDVLSARERETIFFRTCEIDGHIPFVVFFRSRRTAVDDVTRAIEGEEHSRTRIDSFDVSRATRDDGPRNTIQILE